MSLIRVKTLFISFRCPSKPAVWRLVVALVWLAGSGRVSAQTPPVGAAVVEAVSGFYSWYLDYGATGPGLGRTGSVVVDRAYRDSPFLTRRLVQSVDALVTNADPGEGWGDDPFLQARGLPARISIELVSTARHSATVLVGVYHGLNPLPRLLAVRLTDEGGLWKLDDIRPDDVTPAGAVQRFYDAYLLGHRITGEPDAGGVDCVGAFYPTTEAALAAVQHLGIDPFTLSAEPPVSVEAALLWQTARRAEVLLERRFRGKTTASPVVVQLQAADACWQIVRVHASVEPHMAAQVFFNRYLQAARYDRWHGIPLANVLDAIPFPDYMSLWQLEEIRPSLTSPVSPDVDPLLNTADLPLAARAELVEKTSNQATVIVDGIYPDGAGGRRFERLVVLDMERQGDRWLIVNLRPG